MIDSPNPSADAQESFNGMWRDIVCPDGVWDHDQVMLELHDYKMLLDDVPKVYMHVTNGRISKPNTFASAVIGEADEARDADIAVAVQEDREEREADRPGVERLVAALRELLDRCPDCGGHGVIHREGWFNNEIPEGHECETCYECDRCGPARSALAEFGQQPTGGKE